MAELPAMVVMLPVAADPPTVGLFACWSQVRFGPPHSARPCAAPRCGVAAPGPGQRVTRGVTIPPAFTAYPGHGGTGVVGWPPLTSAFVDEDGHGDRRCTGGREERGSTGGRHAFMASTAIAADGGWSACVAPMIRPPTARQSPCQRLCGRSLVAGQPRGARPVTMSCLPPASYPSTDKDVPYAAAGVFVAAFPPPRPLARGSRNEGNEGGSTPSWCLAAHAATDRYPRGAACRGLPPVRRPRWRTLPPGSRRPAALAQS